MVVKIKEKFEETRLVKNIFYEDKEMQDTMMEFYLIQKSLISFLKRTISISFVRARTFDRARTFTRAFDRDFDRREYNDLKFFKQIFYYTAGKKWIEYE